MKIILKAGTAVVTSALLFGTVTPVMASKAVTGASATIANPVSDQGKEQIDISQEEVKVTKEQAVELAKKYVALPEGFSLQGANLSMSRGFGGKPAKTWNLNFSHKEKKDYYSYLSYSLDADSGALLGYNFSSKNPDSKPVYPPKTSLDQAKTIASDYIAKLSPELQKQVKYNDLRESSRKTPLNVYEDYRFSFDRVVDGVPFPQNNITVAVDSEGRLSDYRVYWDKDAAFDKKEGVITPEQADKAFRNQAEPVLQYLIPYQSKELKPAISYSMAALQLDAKTGKPLYESKAPAAVKTLTEQPQSGTGTAVTTKESALKRAQQLVKIPADAKLEEANYSEYENESTKQTDANWNFQWALPGKDGAKDNRGYVSLAIDAKTGELTNFSHYDYSSNRTIKPEEVKVSFEEAKGKAVDFVKKTNPSYAHQLVLETTEAPKTDSKLVGIDQDYTYTFLFSRFIDGVRVENDNIHVGVDKRTGEVQNSYVNISKLAFPAKKPAVLDKDKAKELLLSQYQLRLVYQSVGLEGQIPPGIPIERYNVLAASGKYPTDNQNQKAQLVYTLENKYENVAYFLDAESGKWRSRDNGEVISLEPVKVDDIAGHWAQNELQLMLDYQALEVKDGKVKPDQSIKRGELIKMLVIADSGGGYYPAGAMDGRKNSFKDVEKSNAYFSYVETALDRKWIDRTSDEFNPEQPITREEMASLIVRALNYKKLTEFDNVFNRNFTDASELKNIGNAAIVTGMGIMSADGGKFSPKLEVTRAQAATAFYRYLQKR
ncbi:S-layer homology domain-containing protein [Paenibacillus chitinolyticus]|uniref:S-layer homology domain-containing protein n=1 Tax=Paenibacillus chitinolyticus TaxID=79263 RepID=UPI00366DA679